MKKFLTHFIGFNFIALTLVGSYVPLVVAFAPRVTQAQTPALDYSGIVDCDGVKKATEPGRQRECDFNALIRTVNKIINWMFVFSIPIAASLFAYAGILYMTGVPGNRTKANDIFQSVAIGFIIMLVAWFAVRTLVDQLVKPESGATTFVK